MTNFEHRLQNIQKDYTQTIQSLWSITAGGTIRSVKGSLVEQMARDTITAAWNKNHLNKGKIDFVKGKHRIELNRSYLQRLPEEVRHFVMERLDEYRYILGCNVQKNSSRRHFAEDHISRFEVRAVSVGEYARRRLLDSIPTS